MHPTNQWAHVGGCAGSGDEYEASLEADTVEHIFAKEVTGLQDDRCCGNYSYVKGRYEARDAGVFESHIDAHRPRTRDCGKRLGHSD